MGGILKSALIHTGASAQLANELVGSSSGALTAAGTTQGTALALPNATNIIGTVVASSGVILRADLSPGESQLVVNQGANALAVYPPVGGNINGGAANASVSLATNKSGEFVCTIAGIRFDYVVTS